MTWDLWLELHNIQVYKLLYQMISLYVNIYSIYILFRLKNNFRILLKYYDWNGF